MTGPSAQIPMREPLTSDAADELDRWLRSIAVHIEGGAGDWSLNVRDGDAIGLAGDSGASCTVGVALEAPDYEGDAERAAAAACLGFLPAQWISLDIGCGDADSQRVLGQLALGVAERYSGSIDLGHVVTPAVTMERQLRSAASGAPWFTAAEIRAFVAPFSGKVCEIPSESPFQGLGFYHIVDVEFWRTWLQHPEFHMLK